MLSYYQDYRDEQRDACDICEQQSAYIIALALNNACIQIGK